MFLPSKPSILIIDDDTTILRVFSKIFQKNGYLVDIAEKGVEAVEKLRLAHYDVALVDLCLPDMEGTELFPIIKKQSPDTLRIMLSGKCQFQDSVKDADVLVRKPVSPNQLLSLIESKLQGRDIEQPP